VDIDQVPSKFLSTVNIALNKAFAFTYLKIQGEMIKKIHIISLFNASFGHCGKLMVLEEWQWSITREIRQSLQLLLLFPMWYLYWSVSS
jgi:hypothetical protein